MNRVVRVDEEHKPTLCHVERGVSRGRYAAVRAGYDLETRFVLGKRFENGKRSVCRAVVDGNYLGIGEKRREHAFKAAGEIRLHVPAGNYDADLDGLRGHFSFASIAASSAQAPASDGSVAILPSGTLKNAS